MDTPTVQHRVPSDYHAEGELPARYRRKRGFAEKITTVNLKLASNKISKATHKATVHSLNMKFLMEHIECMEDFSEALGSASKHPLVGLEPELVEILHGLCLQSKWEAARCRKIHETAG